MDKVNVERLIELIEDIARGHYSDEIMALTTEENPEPVRRIAEAMGMMMVKVEAREHQLEGYVEDLKDLNAQLRHNVLATVGAMAEALAARDKYTEGHVERTAAYAARLAERLGLTEDEVESVRLAGMLHDIGKIGFSDKVFQSEDARPSPEIMEEIREHPSIGAAILKPLDFLGPVRDYVLYHHERLSGRGYPTGIAGEEIPLGARILAVADTFDAMTTDRPYQKGKTIEQAAGILRKLSSSELDKELVEAFLQEIEAGGMER